MRRKILTFLLMLILIFTALPFLGVKASNGEKVRVIIQFKRPSYAEYLKSHRAFPMSTFTKETYINNLRKEHENILSSIATEGIYIKKRWDYFLAYNGVGAEVSKDQIENLKRVPGVKNVFIAKTFKPATDLFVPLLGATEVWEMSDGNGLPVTGKGMKIGIIDTGIDYNHPDLGGPGFPNDKVVGGYDFADDDDDPMDPPEQGHGTAVAGIAAGNGKVKGMAPDALLYAYKVFSNQGGASEDDIIAAVEQALKDGCTAVNLSLGSTGGKSEGTPELDTMNNAVDLGLIVVAAAGNEGIRSKELRWPISAPSSAKKAISVAASDEGGGSVNILSPGGFEDRFIPFTYGDGVPEFEEGKEYELVECGYGREKDFEGKDLTGKLALIKRGPLYPERALLFETKYFNALAHGAEGIVVYNCAPGPLITMALGLENHPGVELKPAVFIMEEDGKLLKSLLEAGVKTFSINGNGLKVSFSRKYRPDHLIADFSSQGPTPDGVFKPEISAPGTNTFTTAPEGKYTYRFPASWVHVAMDGSARNVLTVVAEDMNEGEYVAVTDFKVFINVDELSVKLCTPLIPVPDENAQPGDHYISDGSDPRPDIRVRIQPPAPHTAIAGIYSKRKYRPGQTVEVSVKLVNTDTPHGDYDGVHHGTLRLTLTNNSSDNPIPTEVLSREISVSPGMSTEHFTYTVPGEADDIEFAAYAEFINDTLGETRHKSSDPVFIVRTPLIIIHGIMGSELKMEDEVKWNPRALLFSQCDHLLDDLTCRDSNGQLLPDCEVKATQTIKAMFKWLGTDNVLFGDILMGLEKYLVRKGYKIVLYA